MELWRLAALGACALGAVSALWVGVWEGQVALAMVILLASFLSFLYAVVERYPSLTLTHKHVVVTGGSSGIGYAVALACVREGAHVSIVARDVKVEKKGRTSGTFTHQMKI